MKKFLTLLNNEVSRWLCRPAAYVVMAAFFFLCGLNFEVAVGGMNSGPTTQTLSEMFFNSLLFWFPFLLMFPALTMRVFSEEYRSGTIEPLMTAPVRDSEVVLAKFCGLMIFYIVLWLPTLLFFGVFWKITGQSPAETLAGMLGGYLLLLLVGAFYISLGCLASSLTSNQIVAAFVTLAFCCASFFIGLLWFFFPSQGYLMQQVSYYFSTIQHMSDFSRGVLDTRPVVFYLSLTCLGLFLTYLSLQRRRWRL